MKDYFMNNKMQGITNILPQAWGDCRDQKRHAKKGKFH